MKKIFAILIVILLMLSSCKKMQKPNEQAVSQTKPGVTDGQQSDEYVVNYGTISKEMENRDFQYVLGACGYSPSTLESLKEKSDLIVIATPVATFDESEQIWRSGNYPTTDYNNAEMATSYTKRTFSVKKVLKGEQVDKIDVYERAITDGVKTRIAEFEFIADKGDEYLLFLYKAGDSGAYLTPQNAGKYNTNKMYNNKTELFKEVFEEYMTHFTWIED